MTHSFDNMKGDESANPPHRVKVEDAIKYLNKIRETFQDRPEIYSEFNQTMKDFKNQMSKLFKLTF